MAISIKSGTGYDFASSSGPPPAAPLVAGANPASQYAAAGTTSLVFAFPSASGGTTPYVYSVPVLVKPTGSTATVSGTAPGNITINNTANEEAYLIRVTITDADGQAVLNDALGSVGSPTFVPLPPIVAPARQSLPSTTTTASVTFTQPGAPAGMVYVASVLNVTTGASIVPSSGSGLGAYTFTVSQDNDYIVTLEGTALDGQVSTAVATVAVAATPTLAWADPTPVSGTAGTTSLNVVWNTPTGGVTPYIYSDPAPLLDSLGASTTATYSTAGAGAGTTTVSGLVNGQSITISREVTDAAGTEVTVTGTVVVNTSAAPLNAGTSPANQSVDGFTSSVTLGTWGAPSGGTGPYLQVVTDLTGGSTVAGSGAGPYTASGLSASQAYIYRMEVTDSLGAKGYSYMTVAVGAVPSGWQLVATTNLKSLDLTAFSSTSTTVSTTAWWGIVYAADGVTPVVYLRNNTSSQGRTVDLTPGGSGLRLAPSSAATSPSIGVWPAAWTPFLNGSRNDVFLVAAIVKGVNTAGVGGFVDIVGVSTVDAASTPVTGLRVINSGTGSQVRAICYVAGVAEQIYQFFPTGVKREWRGECQVSIADFRRQTIYFTPNSTTFSPPESGQRVKTQATSTSMTTPGGVQTTSATWGDPSIGGRACFVLYADTPTIPTADEGVFLEEIRLYRFPGGSR